MTELCLKDEHEFPDEQVLGRHLGPAKKVWDAFMEWIKNEHTALTTEWRYYKDGKNWLLKVTKKKKTMFWVSIESGMFNTTFYFPDRVEPHLHISDLDKELVQEFIKGRRFGKTRAFTVKVRENQDLATISSLLDIKMSLK